MPAPLFALALLTTAVTQDQPRFQQQMTDKENVICNTVEYYSATKNGHNSATCSNTDGTGRHHGKWNRTHNTNTACSPSWVEIMGKKKTSM